MVETIDEIEAVVYSPVRSVEDFEDEFIDFLEYKKKDTAERHMYEVYEEEELNFTVDIRLRTEGSTVDFEVRTEDDSYMNSYGVQESVALDLVQFFNTWNRAREV